MQRDQSPSGFWQLGVVLVLGISAGTAIGWLAYTRATTTRPEMFSALQAINLGNDEAQASTQASLKAGEAPKYPVVEVVGTATHNFGVTQPGTLMKHTFMIRNRGQAPLELKLKETTCKCLTMGLDEKTPTVVQPGEEYPVELEFRSDKATESFVQKARIQTNDPHLARNVIKLQVEGRVVSRTTIRPESLEVSDLKASSSAQFNFNLYTFAIGEVDPQSIKIESITCDNPVMNEKLKFTWKPMSDVDINNEYQAKGGFEVTGLIPEGMPMDNYAANVTVLTSDGSEASLVVSLKVKAPVTIVGLANAHGNFRFFEEKQFLDFGLIDSKQVAEMDLLFNYRTEKKGQLDFKVAEISHPDVFQVELVGEPRRSDSATIVRLRVGVRPDAPPVLLNGPKRDNMGSVKILTDSVEAPEINLIISVSKN